MVSDVFEERKFESKNEYFLVNTTFLGEFHIEILGVAEYESELVILHFWYSEFSWKNNSKKLEYEKDFC